MQPRTLIVAVTAAFALPVLLLTACSKTEYPKASPEPKIYQADSGPGAYKLISIRELCHEGYIYLVTAEGGISPKLRNAYDEGAKMTPCTPNEAPTAIAAPSPVASNATP